ncbi:hypothetical protein [Jiangella asiatica]|nr:hypothetical protein [Jiangella asiatica]
MRHHPGDPCRMLLVGDGPRPVYRLCSARPRFAVSALIAVVGASG